MLLRGELKSADSVSITREDGARRDDMEIGEFASAIAAAIGDDSAAAKSISDAAGLIAALVSASNAVVIDLAASSNFKITLQENSTLEAPTNPAEGQSGVITITQDATGSRTLAYHAFWHTSGGTPVALSTAAGAIDKLSYFVEPGATRATVQLSKE